MVIYIVQCKVTKNVIALYYSYTKATKAWSIEQYDIIPKSLIS